MPTQTLEATATAALTFNTLPALGQPLDAGVFAGLVTSADGTHHAVVLLPEAPAEEMTWQAAMDWAQSIGGQLPTRPVSATLYANARSTFKRDWYWTCETHERDSSYAWIQYFYGYQNFSGKGARCRARAVRLILLSA